MCEFIKVKEWNFHSHHHLNHWPTFYLNKLHFTYWRQNSRQKILQTTTKDYCQDKVCKALNVLQTACKRFQSITRTLFLPKKTLCLMFCTFEKLFSTTGAFFTRLSGICNIEPIKCINNSMLQNLRFQLFFLWDMNRFRRRYQLTWQIVFYSV